MLWRRLGSASGRSERTARAGSAAASASPAAPVPEPSSRTLSGGLPGAGWRGRRCGEAGRTRRSVDAEGHSWNDRPREGSERTVMGRGRDGTLKWWSCACDGDEGAAADGRRFGRRRRSSESESDEAAGTVEGNASAAGAGAAAAAAAIAQARVY